MKKLLPLLLVLLLSGVYLVAPAGAQGTLSVQVLQLLTRINTWVGTQSFQDLRVPLAAVPSDTSARVYTDLSGNLYFNGALIAGAGGVTNPHNLLSTTHSDTLAASVTRGGVIIGNSTPAWSKLSLCSSGNYIGSNGTDTVCATSAASFTAIPAAQITGTASAFVGTAITALNATNLTSGTVPLARLSGITNTEIAAGAAIAYSKLALTTSILNADIAAGAAIAYSKLALTGSVVTGDLVAATLLFDRWALNGCTANQIPKVNGAGTAWACAADANSLGTVTSATLSMPAMFSVAGSPITTSGTFTVTLATQAANLVLAGPTSGGAVAPTFRSLVNADFPTSGVVAGTGTKVTANAQGIVTTLATASLATDVTGTLPVANGGTNLTSATNHAALVGDGSAWVGRVLPDCVGGALAYTQATHLFACQTGGPAHNLLSGTHTDTVANSPVRGDLIVANSTPAWARFAVGATAGGLLTTNGTDPSWATTVAFGTITSSTPLTLTQTWNASVTFTAWKVNASSTSSNAGSLLADYQLAGSSQWAVDKSGNVYTLNALGVSTTAPTITSGFGTSPSVAGKVHAFRLTLGTPVGTSGVVAFNTTFTNAPVCSGVDETTAAGNPVTVTPTTTQVTVATTGSAVAADKIAVHCDGF